MTTLVRAGIPLPGGRLVEIARDAGLPVLFSANAFMRRGADGEISSVRLVDRAHFGSLNAALDSAGFVAAAKYRGYPWSFDQYLDLVESYDWAWYSGMDLCVEPEIAGSQADVMFRLAETCRLYTDLRNVARDRGMADPMPILQGWTPAQYVWCAEKFPVLEWPSLIGLGSMCRRHLHGEVGVFAVLDALDKVLPPHVQFHMFGLKGPALQHIGQHPRIFSTDSMAWDFAARRDHPVGRNTELRGSYMLNWITRNQEAANSGRMSHTPSLLPVEPEHVHPRLERWLDLVTSNEISGPDARWHAMQAFDDISDRVEGIADRWGEDMFEDGDCHTLAMALHQSSAPEGATADRKGALYACMRRSVDKSGAVRESGYSHMVYVDEDGAAWDIHGKGAIERWNERFDGSNQAGLIDTPEWVAVPCAHPSYSDTHIWLQEHYGCIDNVLQSQLVGYIQQLNQGLGRDHVAVYATCDVDDEDDSNAMRMA